MTGQMWLHAPQKFANKRVRLFIRGLTRPLGNTEGMYTGVWTFTGTVAFREDYLVIQPGSPHELWIQCDCIDAIALVGEEEEEEEALPHEINWEREFGWPEGGPA